MGPENLLFRVGLGLKLVSLESYTLAMFLRNLDILELDQWKFSPGLGN